MKRTILVFCMLLSVGISFANTQRVCGAVPLQVGITDPTSTLDPPKRGPVRIPSITLDDYTLFFNTPCDGSELRLLDEEGDVAYSTVIPDGTTRLVLPPYLSGEYEIRIIRGGFYFWGYVDL